MLQSTLDKLKQEQTIVVLGHAAKIIFLLVPYYCVCDIIDKSSLLLLPNFASLFPISST